MLPLFPEKVWGENLMTIKTAEPGIVSVYLLTCPYCGNEMDVGSGAGTGPYMRKGKRIQCDNEKCNKVFYSGGFEDD